MQRPIRRNQGHDLLVIGGGIAGLTAALHGMQRGLSTLLLEPEAVLGGQIATVASVEGLPLPQTTSGVDLAMGLVDALRTGGLTLLEEAATGITAAGAALQVTTASQTLRAKAVVLATGCRPRPLNVPGETALRGRGVSHCATCDGPFFRGQNVVVAGGGDAALQEALTLADLGATVAIIARGRLRARRAYVQRATATDRIRFIWDNVVDAVLGEQSVTGVRLRNVKTGEATDHACAGVFAYLGGIPNSEVAPSTLPRDAGGCLLTDAQCRTDMPGLYAVGAVRSGYCGEAVSAAGEAAAVVRGLPG